jgi:hypothetical protein
MQNPSVAIVLRAIYRASAHTRPVSRQRLALELRLPGAEVDRVVDALSRGGLVDPERLRLTLPGLAVAVASAREPLEARTRARRSGPVRGRRRAA